MSVKSNSDNILAWIVCLSAGLFFFYEALQLNTFDVINQELRDSFMMNPAKLSWMSSAFIWANTIFLLPAGIILDQYSVKKTILISLSICVIGVFGFALSNTYFTATFFRSLTGIGNAFCFLSCVILVTRWFPFHKQALVMGIIVTMAFTGGIVAHTPFAYLNNQVGWRNAILIDAVFGVIILIWNYFFIQNKTTKTTITNITPWTQKFKGALLNKQNWLAGIYISFLNLPILVLCALWGGSYLTNIHHIKQIEASNIVSLIFIGSIIGCPIVGYISDLHGKRKPTMQIGAITTFLLVLTLIFNFELSTTYLSIIFLAIGIASSTQVIGYPLIAESNPQNQTGIATGIASVIIMSGGGIAQILFGIIMGNNPNNINLSNAGTNFRYAMLIFPIAAFIAFIVTLLMREPYGCSKNSY